MKNGQIGALSLALLALASVCFGSRWRRSRSLLSIHRTRYAERARLRGLHARRPALQSSWCRPAPGVVKRIQAEKERPQGDIIWGVAARCWKRTSIISRRTRRRISTPYPPNTATPTISGSATTCTCWSFCRTPRRCRRTRDRRAGPICSIRNTKARSRSRIRPIPAPPTRR